MAGAIDLEDMEVPPAVITLLRRAYLAVADWVLRTLAEPGFQDAMKWLINWWPIVLVKRAQKTRVAIGIAAGLFLFELASILSLAGGVDLHSTAEHAVKRWEHSVAQVDPSRTSSEFWNYVKREDPPLPLCPSGVTKSVKGVCQTFEDYRERQRHPEARGFFQLITRAPGGIVHTVEYVADQGAAWVVVMMLAIVALTYALMDFPDRGKLLNPYAFGFLLFLLVLAGLAVQIGLEVLLIFVQYTLASLGVIKMVEFALGIPEKVLDIVKDWREGGELMRDMTKAVERLPGL